MKMPLAGYTSDRLAGRYMRYAKRGAHQMRIHCAVDLSHPLREVCLLILQVICILRVLDGPEYPQHARRSPCIT